jgi:hypothetical protein
MVGFPPAPIGTPRKPELTLGVGSRFDAEAHNRRLHRQIDIVVVASSALGLGNVLMLVAFGIGAEGRYLAPTLVCGIVSLLRTVYTERERVDGGFRWLKGARKRGWP